MDIFRIIGWRAFSISAMLKNVDFFRIKRIQQSTTSERTSCLVTNYVFLCDHTYPIWTGYIIRLVTVLQSVPRPRGCNFESCPWSNPHGLVYHVHNISPAHHSFIHLFIHSFIHLVVWDGAQSICVPFLLRVHFWHVVFNNSSAGKVKKYSHQIYLDFTWIPCCQRWMTRINLILIS